MGEKTKIKTIIWDFDGVIVESNIIREQGFREVLSNFPSQQVEQLLNFHNENGGLSRYVKFRFFFEEIRKEQVKAEEIQNYAQKFSVIMRRLMTNKSILISETTTFIRKNVSKFNFHIASGSDEQELRYLCESLDIASCFISIHGSPKPKSDIVKDLIKDKAYNKDNTLLIGDAINDYEAAKQNQIYFMGYNASQLVMEKTNYKIDLK